MNRNYQKYKNDLTVFDPDRKIAFATREGVWVDGGYLDFSNIVVLNQNLPEHAFEHYIVIGTPEDWPSNYLRIGRYIIRIGFQWPSFLNP